MAACLGLLVLVLQAAPLPSVDGMTDLAADGYLELKRRFQLNRTVGVIGSSGNLLYRSHGSEIDRLGAVMRFNGAVTAGYTNDVGVGGDSGDSSGERLIRCAWKHGWEDAEHSQQLGGASVLAPHEFAIRTCPIAGCTDSYPVQNHPAITIEANWLGAVHRNILGGAGGVPFHGFLWPRRGGRSRESADRRGKANDRLRVRLWCLHRVRKIRRLHWRKRDRPRRPQQ